MKYVLFMLVTPQFDANLNSIRSLTRRQQHKKKYIYMYTIQCNSRNIKGILRNCFDKRVLQASIVIQEYVRLFYIFHKSSYMLCNIYLSFLWYFLYEFLNELFLLFFLHCVFFCIMRVRIKRYCKTNS